MRKEVILQQIQELPEKSRFLIGFNEMAKDLSEVMEENEVVQGVVTACKKSITHFVKNGRMVRSFMAVTNRNVYVITRGRLWLNTISLLDENIKIPRREIIGLEQREVPTVLKLFYDAELVIKTQNEEYEIYMGSEFEKYLPADFFKNRTFSEKVSGIMCAECGTENAPEAKFCVNCGSDIVEQQMHKQVCRQCGNMIEEGSKFCPNCGAEVEVEEEANNCCPNCGYVLEESSKFCPNCGKPVEIDEQIEDNHSFVCPNCGNDLEEGAKFCPNCGTPVNPKEDPEPKKCICTGCGKELEAGVKFCPECGTKCN